MIEPQNINISVLPCLSLEQRKALPKCGGIYFAINTNEEILYIGRSANINTRWQQHHRYEQLKQMKDIKIAWLELSDELLLPEIELALIEWFNPSLNNSFIEPSRLVKSNLAELRKRKNLSQDALAQATGLTKTTIQNWENSRNTGAIARILRLCYELDVDIRELFEIENSESSLANKRSQ